MRGIGTPMKESRRLSPSSRYFPKKSSIVRAVAVTAMASVLLVICGEEARAAVDWYVLLSAQNQPDSGPYLAHDNNDGVSLRRRWREVNPAPGVYDWSYLDREMQKVVSSGKGCMIRILAGVHAPDWIYAAGAQPFNTSSGVMPVPYDPVMLNWWHTFVRAMGARYGGVPNLRGVHVAGPTWRSAEMHMPRNLRDLRGYSHAKLINAWNQTVAVYAAAFPRASIVLNLSGAVQPGDKIPESVASTAVFGLFGRAALQFNAMKCDSNLNWRIPNLLATYASMNVTTGAQMVSTFNSEATVLCAIAQTSYFGADYVEVYSSDSPSVRTERVRRRRRRG